MPERHEHKEQIKEAQKRALIASVQAGETVSAACRAAGIGRTTFYKWYIADPEFADAVFHKDLENIEVAEDALLDSARDGNVTAQIFFLSNRAPARWRHVNRVEHSGPDGGTIDITTHREAVRAKLDTLITAPDED